MSVESVQINSQSVNVGYENQNVADENSIKPMLLTAIEDTTTAATELLERIKDANPAWWDSSAKWEVLAAALQNHNIGVINMLQIETFLKNEEFVSSKAMEALKGLIVYAKKSESDASFAWTPEQVRELERSNQSKILALFSRIQREQPQWWDGDVKQDLLRYVQGRAHARWEIRDILKKDEDVVAAEIRRGKKPFTIATIFDNVKKKPKIAAACVENIEDSPHKPQWWTETVKRDVFLHAELYKNEAIVLKLLENEAFCKEVATYKTTLNVCKQNGWERVEVRLVEEALTKLHFEKKSRY